MRSLLAFALLALTVPAQVIDTVGGMTTAPSGANRGKASVYAVTTSVLLTEFEVHLNVTAPETLTFFLYRHHSRTGLADLEWSLPVTVQGGIGPSWYSTGPIALPLVAGNYYMLGVAWAGTVTYYYSIGTGGSPVSFGTWERAHTLNATAIPTPTYTIAAGVDAAQYYQRLTTYPIPAVVNTGTPCSGTTLLPRLVADGFFNVGATTDLELVDTQASSIVVFGLAGGTALPAPLPLFGCSLWLDVTGPVVAVANVSSASGYTALPIAVPSNPLLAGQTFSAQGFVFGATTTDVANATTFTIQ